ncbi:hypothetical protein ACGFNV_22180 [Streptomyces sp. NPDC048751]|uniref:hypothetical protein n=1 Tax=Streptomyces sp. NPDC048751 TaxID=3365591 RepID=UPI00371AB4B0
MATPTTPNGQAPYNWADDDEDFASNRLLQDPPPQRTGQQEPPQDPRRDWGHSGNGQSRAGEMAGAAGAAAGGFLGGLGGSFVPPVTVNIGGGNGNGGRGGGNGGGAGASGGAADRHQGDRLIYAVERIEIRNSKDILALAKAINHLGRELHLILGMRAEEINGVLSTYKGKWYTFGASSRVKARLVSAHLKVSAEAAKALGVGALKMAYAMNRHFIKPEQEARARRNGTKPKSREFTVEVD